MKKPSAWSLALSLPFALACQSEPKELPASESAPAPQVDAAAPPVSAQAALFDKTGRFQLSDVKAIVAEQQDLSGAVDSADPDVDPEVKAVAGMFDASSGRWDVRKVMEGGELTPKDLSAQAGSASDKNGETPAPPG